MPSLEQQAAAARQVVRDHEGGKIIFPGLSGRKSPKHLAPMQRDTLVLLCMYNGWGRDIGALRTGLGANVIRNRSNAFRLEPWLMFHVPILHRGMFGKKPLWRCEVCLARLPSISETKAREHAALHFISPLEMRTHGVMNPWGD